VKNGMAKVTLRTPRWPFLAQLQGPDHLGLAGAARSPRTHSIEARTQNADAVVPSICPYCAVGCGQRVYVRSGEIVQIEGDPASPISRGRLCPKGAATKQLVTGSHRQQRVRYRAPFSREWQDLELATAMEMIADRVIATRKQTWEEATDAGPVHRTMGIASLGGATLDNEENYVIKKLFTSLGIVSIENQARI
jgi:formate dehydrogenase major subunit